MTIKNPLKLPIKIINLKAVLRNLVWKKGESGVMPVSLVIWMLVGVEQLKIIK